MTKTLILILYILGLGMILLGFMTADKILLPPIVTGLGFFCHWIYSMAHYRRKRIIFIQKKKYADLAPAYFFL